MLVTKAINLDQLAAECLSAGESRELVILRPDEAEHEVLQVMASGDKAELTEGQQAAVNAHVAMRCKTNEELAAEFRNSSTTADRRQEIRDMQSGLLPCEQVPM